MPVRGNDVKAGGANNLGSQSSHRDLKPANIKLKPNGTVKVLGFGLAKAVSGWTGAVLRERLGALFRNDSD